MLTISAARAMNSSGSAYQGRSDVMAGELSASVASSPARNPARVIADSDCTTKLDEPAARRRCRSRLASRGRQGTKRQQFFGAVREVLVRLARTKASAF